MASYAFTTSSIRRPIRIACRHCLCLRLSGPRPNISRTGSRQLIYRTDGLSRSRCSYRQHGVKTRPLPVSPNILVLQASLASWFDSTVSYNLTQCYLVPAILEYDITIEDQRIGFQSGPEQGRFIARANNTRMRSFDPADAMKKQKATIDGLTDCLSKLIYANASAALNENSPPGVIYNARPGSYTTYALKHENWTNGAYDLNFADPTPDITFNFHYLMLRAAAKSLRMDDIQNLVNTDVAIDQTVVALQSIERNVFKSDMRYYAAAAVLELATVLVIMPLFWGWWTLGCHITLSPFGLALAFDSPILKWVNSAPGTRGVVRQLGGMRLKFGEMISNPPTAALEQRSVIAKGRLGIAESQNLVQPRKGMQFSE